MLAVYGYHAYNHYEDGSMYIHRPDRISTAENLLRLLKARHEVLQVEAHVLTALIPHMEHGGGNNSTSPPMWLPPGTDTYSVISAARLP